MAVGHFDRGAVSKKTMRCSNTVGVLCRGEVRLWAGTVDRQQLYTSMNSKI